ncbi:hypothetical protein AXK12_06000 [Cephaloticoccus capnophilus]|uniref:Methyltransferase type 11 domain-containing protein n=1 Tax=Cephaloticoccus capnophilus TaxID=1548208 RepID=A0A139SL85_9BACT|nr:class I SAM-dependent methyltransferase [Cephaloticoccus capnophilus]KXU35250.1 hypothetical protein AXK12_06000 [Cephaloticoccus capnophilus]
MELKEYANMDRVEKAHWYNVGKREFVRRWIAKVRPPNKDDVLLDCGAGTGLFAKEMEAYCQVLALDALEPALELLRQRFRPDQVIAMTGKDIPLPGDSVNYLTALDVVEHIEDDVTAVRGFHRVLKPGGVAVITVPASMLLWSEWDVSLHHYRRYNRRGLLALFPKSDWEILHSNYTNSLAFLPALLLRKLRGRKPQTEKEESRTEFRIPPSWLNKLLKWIFVKTAMSRFPMPFGLSLILVARKKG